MVTFIEIRKLVTIVLVLIVISNHTCGPKFCNHPTWKYYKFYMALSTSVDSPRSSSVEVFLDSTFFVPVRGPLEVNEDFKKTIEYPVFSPNDKKTCVKWILFYGFTATDPITNWLMAIHRDMRNDEFMHEYASGYAQKLDYLYYKNAIKPSTYCRTRTVPLRMKKETRKSCEEFIQKNLYTTYHLQFNMDKALNRDRSLDGNTNECAAGYGQFLTSLLDERIVDSVKPNTYCLRRLEGPEYLMHDISLKKVFKPCHGWILHYGYTIDNLTINIKLASERDPRIDYLLSEWAAVYAEMLATNKKEDKKLYLPVEFCHDLYNMTENVEVLFKLYDANVPPKKIVLSNIIEREAISNEAEDDDAATD